MTDKLDQPHKKNNEWMIVYTSNDISDAHIVRGRLEHDGIPAFVDHIAGMGSLGITIGRWGEVRVLVHPENYHRALLILNPEYPDGLPEEIDDILYDWGSEKSEDDE